MVISYGGVAHLVEIEGCKEVGLDGLSSAKRDSKSKMVS